MKSQQTRLLEYRGGGLGVFARPSGGRRKTRWRTIRVGPSYQADIPAMRRDSEERSDEKLTILPSDLCAPATSLDWDACSGTALNDDDDADLRCSHRATGGHLALACATHCLAQGLRLPTAFGLEAAPGTGGTANTTVVELKSLIV